ncbi:chemosensory receptor c [Plakobranchus ocellatus]|uniref:Chemosensory receptor c n=1 Tax=Plakobranchus ocellatus TaxID=259542 RepID=A0AAV4AYS4_9GAST|nr:chemosensory receptor c [Plakobranchus ocellatus]
MEISHQVTTVAEKPAQGLISRSAYNISLITLNSIQACMCMLGLITNVINIKIFLAMRAFDDGVTLTFLLLSISDLCVCFVAAGISMSAFLHSQETKWLKQIIFNDDGTVHSQAIGFFFSVEPTYIGIVGHHTFQIFNLITILLTIYLAVARCLCVMYPLKFRNIITVRKTLLVSVIFFITSLGIRLPLMTHSGVALKFDPRINSTRHRLWVHPNREIIRDALWITVDSPGCIGAQITLSVCIVIMVKVLSAAANFRSKASAANGTRSDINKSQERYVKQAKRDHTPQFSGLSTSSLTPRQFLTDFENFTVLCNISGDSKFVATFQLHLTGEARWWFDDLPSDLRSSWAKVKDAFQLRFVQRNLTNTSDFIHQENLFLQMQLAPGQSINSIFYSIKKKVVTLGKSQSDLLARFVYSLPPDLAFFVRAGHPSSPEEALSVTRNGEAYGYRQQSPAPQPQCAAAATSRSSDDIIALRRELRRLSDQVFSLVISPPRPQGPQENGPRVSRPPQARQDDRPTAYLRPYSVNSAVEWVKVLEPVGPGL